MYQRPTESNKQQYFGWHLGSQRQKRAGFGSGTGKQVYGSKDPVSDPY
jgi:hypothetical protein